MPHPKFALEDARQRGLEIARIVDIGAYHGEWSRMAAQVWPNARITMVEANAEKQPILAQVAQTLDAELHIELLGAEEATEFSFYVMESGSSVYEEESPLERRVETRQLGTLDALLRGETVDLIKIDAQGYELEVLKGAQKALLGTKAILLEIALIGINKGEPVLDEVLCFMRNIEFVSYEIVEIHRRPLDRAMNQVDILFVRAQSPLLQNRSHF